MKKLLIILCVFISFYGCRTVKKDWLELNYASKADIEMLQDKSTFLSESLKNEIRETLNKDFDEKLKQERISESTKEDETTTVKGTIEAEEGKEKTAEIGNTKIKSNGANISFETTTSKAISKEFESRYQQLEQKLLEESKKTERLQSQLNSLKSEIANLRSNQETEKTTKSKEKNSKGLTFGTILTLIIILVLAGLVWYYWKKISAFLGGLRVNF